MAENTISWTVLGPESEIRTVLFNWPVEGVPHRMFYKEQFNFRDLVAADFGLKEGDTDTHSPQFLLLTKTTETATSGAAFRAIFRGH